MHARVIHLRRPPRLVIADESPFVPDLVSLDEVDRRWGALRAKNPAYFDGSLYHVIGVHRDGHGGATIHTQHCSYRMQAVQDKSFDTGARGLGTKGILIQNGCVLVGKRSEYVGRYPGLWEFAPAGVVEIGREPANVITTELFEETGLQCAKDAVPIAVIYDDVARCWEIIYRFGIVRGEISKSDEYPELEWVRFEDIPVDLSPPARLMLPLVKRAAASD